MPFVKLLLLIALLLPCQGCASIFTGTSDEIAFTSEPPGAEVLIDGQPVGKTPCTANVSKRVDDVVFRDNSRGERKVHLESKFQFGFFLLDLLFTPGFGASGILLDTLMQGWWDHPAIVHCDFTRPPAVAKKEPVAAVDGTE